MSADLPPPNPNAHNLHLTDLEFDWLMSFIESQPTIGKAWVYGSRRSGRRRPKDGVKPPDVDLAAELVNVPEDEYDTATFRMKCAADKFFVDPDFVHLEFREEGSGVAEYIATDGATLIFERT